MKDQPAFPTEIEVGRPEDPQPNAIYQIRTEQHPGMTLRDYFAAKALQEVISYHGTHSVKSREKCATEAYLMADMMLKERDVGKEK